MQSSNEMILHNVRLPLMDENMFYKIIIQDGMYKRIEQQPGYATEVRALSIMDGKQVEVSEIDVEGRIILPSFVDIHTHMDKAFSLKDVPNESGTLQEAISNYSQKAHLFSKEEIKKRVYRSALQSLSFGTTHIRTHVNFELDVSQTLALEHLQAVLEVKSELSPYVSMQVVPMFSKMSGRTKREMEIIEEAIQLGVDGIGGAPHIFPDAEANIEKLFQLAIKYDKFIDLHVDENDNPAICTIEQLIEKTKQYGLQGRVTAGHLCSLAAMEQKKADQIMSSMAEQQINAITLPGANMYLQGRADRGVVRRGITRVKELVEYSVPVATASDNINDPFHPFGRGDMLQIGLLTAYAAHMASKTEILHVLKMITTIPGRMFGIDNHQVEPGAYANFVVFDTNDVYDMFGSSSPSRYIFTKGKWLTSTTESHSFGDRKLEDLWNGIKQSATIKL
ncbi:amidohydrolase family protein [Aquibacillus koreensis]|uniref:Amidohydrolase family protein n=1 Tax=Aquibacillus koreensis TaxID=279446 RepID=A0A9X3WLT8_9BACI|nr:amidohydrolase family protein [Aquibacillus koreensis]MCT2537784.1 amidohydrolase family protein [Aquibacillus koreensis]MDC3421183.1 amidohydrolase family protein [Aquibacillus koreensis]